VTILRGSGISLVASIVIVAIGRALLAADIFFGAVILFPGGIVEMLRVGGVHGSSHSVFLTELCTVGVSMIVWLLAVLLALGTREVIVDLVRKRK
jgi:hypothetical protein